MRLLFYSRTLLCCLQSWLYTNFPHNNTLKTYAWKKINEWNEHHWLANLFLDFCIRCKHGSSTVTSLKRRLLNIFRPDLIWTHSHSSDLFTTSLNYATHSNTLCQMLRSEEFLQLWNACHSGKYNEQSKQRSTQVWLETKEMYPSWSNLFFSFPFASTFF